MKRLLSFVLLSAALSARAGDAFTLADTKGDHLDVRQGSRLVARYMYAHDTGTSARRGETYKPFLHVFDPAGQQPITKGPGGEYTHHRGIFIGWAKITVDGKSYDRWHMKGGDQVHGKFSAQKEGADGAGFVSHVSWMGAGDAPILEEERAFAFLPPTAPAYAVIEMTSTLRAVAGEATIDGDPEHAGLQYRPANEVDRAKTVYFFPAEKPQPHKDRDYPWFGETCELKGQRYSVVFLSHPSNPTNTAISAYRNYGRFGVFPKFTIPAGGTRTVRARFLICAGEMPPAATIQKAWNDYAGRNDPVPVMSSLPAEQPKPAAPKAPAK